MPRSKAQLICPRGMEAHAQLGLEFFRATWFPCLISDEQWVRASAARLREQGVIPFMRDQLRKMRETLLGTGMTLPE